MVICGGLVETVIVNVKLLPEKIFQRKFLIRNFESKELIEMIFVAIFSCRYKYSGILALELANFTKTWFTSKANQYISISLFKPATPSQSLKINLENRNTFWPTSLLTLKIEGDTARSE